MSILILRSSSGNLFPLNFDSSNRFLRQANGTPFFIHGDTAWYAPVQLTTAQIDQYLNDRQARGFNAVILELIIRGDGVSTAKYTNANGDAPFTTMLPNSWTSRVEAYWHPIDYLINGLKARGMVAYVWPAYFGFNSNASGLDGWLDELNAASDADLQNYGAFLGNRYTQGNLIWSAGGDSTSSTSDRTKQWQVMIGLRSAQPNALITGDPLRVDADPWAYWGPGGQNFTGFNVNVVYAAANSSDIATESATAYGRSPAMPFFLKEGWYEGDLGRTAADARLSAYQAVLSGCCGHFFGNYPMFAMGSPFSAGTAQSVLDGNLSTTATTQMGYLRALMLAYQWWKLVPKTDTTLITSSLGSGATIVCPALSSDNTFAMVWIPTSQTVTVNMAVFAQSSVRARLFDPTAGTYSTVSGSPFANSGTQNIASGGERVLVLDAP